jgi:DNA-binding response OmpR family regulator
MSAALALILVADDDPDIRTLVSAVLRAAGYGVVPARDGEEALAVAATHELRAAVLDVFMPRIGGLEVCRTLRGGEATSALPIVLLSAHGEPDDFARGYEEGASKYMSKPFRPRELVAAVRELVN